MDPFHLIRSSALRRAARTIALVAAFSAAVATGAQAQPLTKTPAAYAGAGPTLDLPPPLGLGPVDHLAPRFYVANENDSVVDTFSQRGPYRAIGSIYGFLFPDAVAVGPNGDVVVADEITYVISVFAPNAISPRYSFQTSRVDRRRNDAVRRRSVGIGARVFVPLLRSDRCVAGTRPERVRLPCCRQPSRPELGAPTAIVPA